MFTLPYVKTVCYHQNNLKAVISQFQRKNVNQAKNNIQNRHYFLHLQKFFLSQISFTHILSPPFLSWSMLTLSWTGQLIRSSRARRVWSDIIFLSRIKYLVFQKDLEYFSLLFNLQISKKWYKGFLTRASNTFYGSHWDQRDHIWKICLRRLLPLTGSSFTPAIR